MFRRTDCHFSLVREDTPGARDGPADMSGRAGGASFKDSDDMLYLPHMTSLLEAQDGRVYLDTAHPRVCIAGPEERERDNLGYARLADEEARRPYQHGAVLCRTSLHRGCPCRYRSSRSTSSAPPRSSS